MAEIEWIDEGDERFLELIDNVRPLEYDQLHALNKNIDYDEDSLWRLGESEMDEERASTSRTSIKLVDDFADPTDSLSTDDIKFRSTLLAQFLDNIIYLHTNR